MASIYPGLEGLLSGFQARRQQVEQQNYARALQASQSESAVFQALLNSSDPEIRAKAATGLLTSAMGPQKSSGIRGWLGEMDQNPIVAQMRTLMATPTTQEVPTQVPTGEPAALPSRNITGTIGQPPTTALAQPSTQTTTPGAPGPAATTPDRTGAPSLPPTVGRPPSLDLQTGPLSHPSAPTQTVMQTEQVPREIFPTAEEQAIQRYRGEYMGQVQGIAEGLMAGGMPREQAYQVAEMHFMRSLGAGAGLSAPETGIDQQGNNVTATLDRRYGSPTFDQWITTDENGVEHSVPGFTKMSIQQPRGLTNPIRAMHELFPNLTIAQIDKTPGAWEQINQRTNELNSQQAAATTGGRMGVEATGPLSREQATATVNRLTERWNTSVRPIQQAQLQLTKLDSALARFDADPNGASQAVLDAFQEITNPQSGVGSSEYARTAEGQTLLQRFQALYGKYTQTGGQGVTKENLQALAATAKQIVDGMNSWSGQFRSQIANEARTGGLADDQITGIFGGMPGGVSPNVAAPPPGAQPAGGSAGPQGLFVGADGKLHTGSPTGPIHQVGGGQ